MVKKTEAREVNISKSLSKGLVGLVSKPRLEAVRHIFLPWDNRDSQKTALTYKCLG